MNKYACDFCSKVKETQEIYGELKICEDCKKHEDEVAKIAESIEG
jgi:hypothetical protein